MCSRYSAWFDLLRIAEQLGAELATAPDARSANVAPTELAPLLVARPSRRIGLARFGFELGGAHKGERVMNARSETAAKLPRFRESALRRRAVALADGYYEWKGKAREKTPYFIHAPDRSVLLLAALFEVSPARELEYRDPRFVIVTQASRGSVAPLHDRMPVFLGPASLEAWLDPRRTDVEAQLEALVREPVQLAAHAVGREVGNVRVKGPWLREPARSGGGEG